MKKLIFLTLLLLPCFTLKLFAQNWSNWVSFGNNKGVSAAISFFVRGPKNGNGISWYRTNNTYIFKGGRLFFAFDYKDDKGMLRTQTGMINLEKSGVNKDPGYFFVSNGGSVTNIRVTRIYLPSDNTGTPKDKNDNSTTDNQPFYGYFKYGQGHTYYYSQVITVPSKRENGVRMIDWDAGKPFDDAFKKTLNDTGIPTNSDQGIYFQTSYGTGIGYASKEEAEQGRQKEIKNIQEDKNDSYNGYSVTELTINVPNKTKSKKQMVYGGSAYVKVKNLKTGDEYYLVSAYSCNEQSIAEAKRFLRIKWLPNDWNTTKETPIHYSIDSVEFLREDRKHYYSGTATVKVQNFKTGEIRTVHSVFATEGDDKGDIKSRLTSDIVGQLNYKDENDEELITPVLYIIKEKNKSSSIGEYFKKKYLHNE